MLPQHHPELFIEANHHGLTKIVVEYDWAKKPEALQLFQTAWPALRALDEVIAGRKGCE